ncbi:helix-turn-helix transcriptional regulator [Nocardia amamiensis]|uniref:Helix-turn-helix transcriptional regulator n=1 Tax=Nocardia amamiensis TaxID=404578 RepID=A0ABS0CLU2_9NOCA|nr:AraC family transcriptional regulator [Nocardia amamiensis]MBF6297580.1 helix-turn-helix transcriptional regulator [Nocardia amamiensis]
MTVGALSEICGPATSPVVWLRPGHVGYIGPELGVDLHSVSVAVLSVGLDGPFVLETAAHGQIRTRSSFAPARASHRVVAPERWILLLFVDPAGTPATGIAGEMTATAGPYGLAHRREQELVELCRGDDVDPDRIFAQAVAGSAPVADPRIEWAAAAIRRNPNQTFRADTIAANLGLSTTHFLRLFAQRSGTTFRGYQRWTRVVHALRDTATGRDLTRSATDAGFATPSHFSETFHHMFGLSATALLRSGVRFDLGTQPAPGCFDFLPNP